MTFADKKAAWEWSARARRARLSASEDFAMMTRKEGLVEAAELLENGVPDLLAGVRVRRFLLWVPWIGPIRAAEIMQTAGIAQTTRLRTLNETRRWELADLLRELAR